MNWTLELVSIPVTDVERAKQFYAELLGFVVDHDTTVSEQTRIVQLTPPGSGCSICIGTGFVDMAPGALRGLQLVVRDIRAARAELSGRGVDVSEVMVFAAEGLRPAAADDALNNVGFCFFSDPDGTGWAVQQIDNRG
ncbi:MAG: VOC family protein [Geodermatophilaceae bacterium]|nr:VOC family protein [Geodermatophilaceae bacterium]MDQ3456976.1 VOC family protein [Actinomycetota bacterium]